LLPTTLVVRLDQSVWRVGLCVRLCVRAITFELKWTLTKIFGVLVYFTLWRFCRMAVPVLYLVQFYGGENTWNFPWRLHGNPWNSIKIHHEIGILHGIPWKILFVLAPWNFIGNETWTAMLQVRQPFLGQLKVTVIEWNVLLHVTSRRIFSCLLSSLC